MATTMRKIIPLIFMVCLTAQAANETTHEITVTRIASYHDYAVLSFSPAFTHSQPDCLASKTRAIINYEEDSITRKEMYSLILAAATTGKKVTLGISGCFADHPKVYRVDVSF